MILLDKLKDIFTNAKEVEQPYAEDGIQDDEADPNFVDDEVESEIAWENSTEDENEWGAQDGPVS